MSPESASSVSQLSSYIERIYKMEEGQLTEVIEIDTGKKDDDDNTIYNYLIVYVDNIVINDRDEIHENKVTDFEKQVKDNIFSTAMEEMISEAVEGELNYDIINRYNITSLQK